MEHYDHLKLRTLKEDYKYVLFENKDFASSALRELISLDMDFFFFSFQGEVSLICRTDIALDAKSEMKGWTGIRIVGEMPFGSVQGLISNISNSLMEESVGVCIVSTYLTDVFFIREKYLTKATSVLSDKGWKFEN